MPSRQVHKRAADIVVRPMGRGSRATTKTVLGTMSELNRHAPLEDIAPHLIVDNPKPWKQASRAAPRLGRANRRNAGRDDGRTWVSRRFVCGAAMESEWDGPSEEDTDADEEWAQDPPAKSRSPPPVEFCLMDIARPAKQRGSPRGYAVVGRAGTLLPLEDEWEILAGDDDDEWESVVA
ncbi:hypothetical protein C8Q74DRAFT_1370312 [Fomes fomentarius]|nr:hypothetical protein C8Q74DRAFT_1370312 [Fomes fomentarius]